MQHYFIPPPAAERSPVSPSLKIMHSHLDFIRIRSHFFFSGTKEELHILSCKIM